jgi:hypothetical protein
MSRYAAIAVVVVASACTALSGIHVRSGDTGRQVQGMPSVPRDTGTFGSPGVGPAGQRMPSGQSNGTPTKRVCRVGSWPTGWIAVAYTSGSTECPARAGRDSAYTVAELVRFDDRPFETVLKVCADQATPFNWIEDRKAERTGGVCPGASKPGEPDTKIIRRMR